MKNNEQDIKKSHDIIGDANVNAGRKEMYREVIGRYSKHGQSNTNELRLIELSIERNMKTMSTHLLVGVQLKQWDGVEKKQTS